MFKFFATMFFMEITSIGRGLFSACEALGWLALIVILFCLRGWWLPILIGLAIKAAVIGAVIFAVVSLYRYFA